MPRGPSASAGAAGRRGPKRNRASRDLIPPGKPLSAVVNSEHACQISFEEKSASIA